jgi:hypothetical protein
LQLGKSSLIKPGRISVGILSMLLVLLLNLLAASPSLHEKFHADAGKAEHHCAVTLFAHGQVDTSIVVVALPVPAAPVEFLTPTSLSILNAMVETLPPGRGPPVSLLHG